VTNISGTNVCDASGNKIKSGTITFTPTLDGKKLASFRPDGGGAVTATTIAAKITNGAFSLSLCDTVKTEPKNISYHVQVFVVEGGPNVLGPGYTSYQPTGSADNFDNYIPRLTDGVAIQTGPQGDSAYQVAVEGGFSGTQAQWIASLKGAPGDVSKPLLGSGVGTGVSAQLPTSRNLFNKATITSGLAPSATTGAPLSVGSANYYMSDFLFVGGLTQIISNSMMADQSSYSCCFYAIDGSFISSLSAPVSANTPIAVPAGAALFRFYSAVAADSVNTAPVPVGQIMVVAGNVLPSTYTAFGYYPPEVVDNKVAQVSSLVGASVGAGVSAQLPTGRNIFNKATIVPNQAPSAATGAPLATSGSNYYMSDFLYVGGLTQIISNSLMAAQSGFSCCFYGIDKAFISSLSAPVAANTPIPVPAGAAFFRFYSAIVADAVNAAPVPVGQIMVVAGSVVPSTYTAFGYYPPEVVDSKLLKIGTDTKNSIQGYFAQYANLLDLNRVQVNAAIHYANVNAIPAVTAGNNGFNLYGPIPVIAGGTVTANKPLHTMAGYGPAFMDVDGNFLPMGADLKAFWQAQVGIPANTTLNVPANAAYYWPYFNINGSGTGDVGKIDNINTAMVVQGATFPSSYRPFVGQGFDLVARNAAQPLSGVKVGWLGDSISYGQGSNLKLSTLVAAITGMQDTYSLSWPGRKMNNALDNTGNTGVTAPTQAIFQNLDVVVIWLGTNLSGTSTGNIGTASDPVSVGTANANGVTFPSADTYCSQLKGVIEQLLTWNQNLRIVKASPYQSNNQNAETGSPEGVGNLPSPAGLALLKQVHDMDVAVAGLQYGIPVLDCYSEMGLCNANNPTLTVDGTHPTAWFQQNRIAPFFARKIERYSIK